MSIAQWFYITAKFECFIVFFYNNVKKHSNNFMKTDGNKYIIELSDLVNAGHLVSPIKLSDNEDITNEKKKN